MIEIWASSALAEARGNWPRLIANRRSAGPQIVNNPERKKSVAVMAVRRRADSDLAERLTEDDSIMNISIHFTLTVLSIL
jgi:hypothetical protein